MDKILKIIQKQGSSFIGVEAIKEDEVKSFAFKVQDCQDVKIGDVILAHSSKEGPTPFNNMHTFLKFKKKLEHQEVNKQLSVEGKHFSNETTDIFL